jgi:hypothetical protein
MDWSWRCTELATEGTGSECVILPCVRLLESYDVSPQGKDERRTIPANFQRCKNLVRLQVLWSYETENVH